MTVQVFDQVLERLRIMATHSPIVISVAMVIDLNALKDVDLLQLLTKVERSYGCTRNCEHRVVWQNLIYVCELH